MQTDIFSERELFQQTYKDGQPELAQAADLAETLNKRLTGEARFDAGSRALYATDLSIYRQLQSAS